MSDVGDLGDLESTGRRAARRARADSTHRLPSLVVLLAVLAAVVAAGLAVDRRAPAAEDAEAALPRDLAAVAPAADSLGSTWFCVAGTGTDDGTADHVVIIANVSDRPVDVVVTVVAGAPSGEAVTATPATESLEIPVRGETSLRLGDVLEAPLVSAIVEAGRGEIVVEHAVTGGADPAATPCATSSSATWHLAAGTTTRDATELLVLFNPFPDDAVVDVTFTTPEGLRSPPAFAGFIVPGRRTIAVNVGEVVSRHPNVATTIVARSGRLVVERLQSFDSTSGPAGLAVTPAAPRPALVWSFPDGLVGEGISEVVTVYNPGEVPAEIDVEIDLDPGTDPSIPQVADPFALSIPPRGFQQVVMQDDDRVPDGVGHSITVRSQNGVPVVAERWVRSSAPRSGFAAVLGSPVVATRWLAAIGATSDAQAEYLVIVNPSVDAIARISITSPTSSQSLAIAGLEDVEVPEAGRLVLDMGSFVNRDPLPLVLTSTLPIVVERGLYRAAGGFDHAMLVPSGPTATIPPVDPSVES